MTEAQFELMLGAFREQHNELRAIHEAALGKLRGISYALYIILGINLVILAGLAGVALARPARCPLLVTASSSGRGLFPGSSIWGLVAFLHDDDFDPAHADAAPQCSCRS